MAFPLPAPTTAPAAPGMASFINSKMYGSKTTKSKKKKPVKKPAPTQSVAPPKGVAVGTTGLFGR